MIRDDYIMRMIEQFAMVLAKILFNKEINNFNQVKIQLNHAAAKFLGLDLRLLRSLPIEEILSFFTLNENLDLSKCYIAAEILREDAERLIHEHESEEFILDSYLKSFRLYYEVIFRSDDFKDSRYYARVEPVIAFISNYQIPTGVKFKLFQLRELEKNYPEAENLLFELLSDRYENILELAQQFYTRLLELNDAELEKRNLPRDEVIEGLERVKKLSAS